ncbi:hypothetical protein VL21_13985 [Stenotrophomonas maltophilia]|nr:hypothetical protein AA979_06330 [Stenotrophomonas maltophilia]KOO76367.1 hypothetical protein VL21_13985 [Stenotrophomonas maltophilia]
MLRIAAGMHAGQLTAEAVATDDPGQRAGLVIRRDKDRLAGGQILFEYLAIAPVLRARRPQ